MVNPACLRTDVRQRSKRCYRRIRRTPSDDVKSSGSVFVNCWALHIGGSFALTTHMCRSSGLIPADRRDYPLISQHQPPFAREMGGVWVVGQQQTQTEPEALFRSSGSSTARRMPPLTKSDFVKLSIEFHIMPGMNKLPAAKRAKIPLMLCEGSSMQSTAGGCEVAFNRVAKLLAEVGEAYEACEAFHDESRKGTPSQARVTPRRRAPRSDRWRTPRYTPDPACS